ncbi:MAG: hypothetical protein ACO3NE_02725 [Alphaproteobacteria bacterium]
MVLRKSTLLLAAAAFLYLSGCSSLSGSTRDAFAPFVELSQPETVNNVIVGGTNPYATSVEHSLAAPTAVTQGQTIGIFASSQAAAQQMIFQAVRAQCGETGVMGPVEYVNGQWVSRVQCGTVATPAATPYNAVNMWPQ